MAIQFGHCVQLQVQRPLVHTYVSFFASPGIPSYSVVLGTAVSVVVESGLLFPSPGLTRGRI